MRAGSNQIGGRRALRGVGPRKERRGSSPSPLDAEGLGGLSLSAAACAISAMLYPHGWTTMRGLSILRTISIVLDAGMELSSVMLWNAASFTLPTWSAFSKIRATSIATQLWASAA